MEVHQRHANTLIECIELEMKEQENRLSIKDDVGLKQLKAQGVVMHPIRVTRKSFGYADYPELQFDLPFRVDVTAFKDASSIECFIDGEDTVKGILLNFDGRKGTARLLSSDFPEWIEEKGVGIKLSPDHHTAKVMKFAVNQHCESNLFKYLHSGNLFGDRSEIHKNITFNNSNLNQSQRNAVEGVLGNDSLLVLHGPPGTGKTTTLVEAVHQLIRSGKKILITAPSNAAIDHFAKSIIPYGIKFLRVGNSLKTDQRILPFTIDGKMADSKEFTRIKKLRIQSEEYRKLALQYRRNFGKEDRDQRKLLLKEVKNIRNEIRELRSYFEEKLVEQADVLLGTPIGLYNFLQGEKKFDTLIVDEAGQCLEPLFWSVYSYADNYVLAGDPFQLPPTVLSDEAKRKGFSVSILEHAFKSCRNQYFIDTQYRMQKSIAEFSNQYFYEGKLKTSVVSNEKDDTIVFYDTAGTGYIEEFGKDGMSLENEGEINLIEKILTNIEVSKKEVSVISPYSGQVASLKEIIDQKIRVSTIDSFQGQENNIIILTLVRSNDSAEIGFLKDYRRMNVALTRAKNKLIVIGDSATIGQDPFYAEFLEYLESINAYKSAWEIMD